jgi:hypothetical protein
VEFLDLLLGRDKQRTDDGIPGLIKGFSRWIIGCGCMVLMLIIAGIVLLAAGTIQLSEQAVLIVIVFITILVAVASLIRSSLGGHYPD